MSNASATCRLEWRPSRWLVALLVMLGAFAVLSVMVSDLPTAVSGPFAVLVAVWAVWLARREAVKPVVELQIRDGVARVDGNAVEQFQLEWRGVLVFAHWQGAANSRRRLVWWPDTLDRAGRRELRLAAPVETPVRTSYSMAP